MNSKSINNVNIVIIDDEESVCRSYVDELVWKFDFNSKTIQCFTDPRVALTYLEEKHQQVDVILLDLKMPHIMGLDMLRHIHNIDEKIKIIVISAFAGIDSVKTAVLNEEETKILEKSVDKPVTDFKQLSKIICKAYRKRRGSDG